MFDLTTPRGRIADAALKLASTRPWADVSLLDVAAAANVSLADLRKAVGSKSQIVAVIMRAIDDQVLAKAGAVAEGPVAAGQARRDQIFEVVMSRFDAMMPHKAAIKSIAAAGSVDTSLVMPFLNSQRWMLAAAGVDADGPAGLVRTAGLGAVYYQVFNIWLAEDDAGMSRTMAALDQRLRRGERALGTVEGVVNGIGRIATDLPGVLRSVFRGTRAKPAPADPLDRG
jgi:ubiquinone biosynthesis protein COQ9